MVSQSWKPSLWLLVQAVDPTFGPKKLCDKCGFYYVRDQSASGKLHHDDFLYLTILHRFKRTCSHAHPLTLCLANSAHAPATSSLTPSTLSSLSSLSPNGLQHPINYTTHRPLNIYWLPTQSSSIIATPKGQKLKPASRTRINPNHDMYIRVCPQGQEELNRDAPFPPASLLAPEK